MVNDRIEQALTRIEVAMNRLAEARPDPAAKRGDNASSARIMTLVNDHEKLREEIAETLSDLDALIEELDG